MVCTSYKTWSPNRCQGRRTYQMFKVLCNRICMSCLILMIITNSNYWTIGKQCKATVNTHSKTTINQLLTKYWAAKWIKSLTNNSHLNIYSKPPIPRRCAPAPLLYTFKTLSTSTTFSSKKPNHKWYKKDSLLMTSSHHCNRVARLRHHEM